jgi:methyltransferase (TIGR00027 family)
MKMFINLKTVDFVVGDLNAAKEWYTNLLDAKPIIDLPFAVVFRVGSCGLSLVPGFRPLPENTGRTVVFWEVADVDFTSARMVDLGAKVQSPARNVMNFRRAVLLDPFGNMIGLAGPLRQQNERIIDSRPSTTAQYVALYRAVATFEEDEEIRGGDTFARLFVSEQARAALTDPESRNALRNRTMSLPLFGFFIARTKFLDDEFLKALGNGIPQIVLLGAGYDSRPYRFGDRIRDTRIFEVDAPTTQAHKREILRLNGIEPHPNHRYAAVDFNKDKLETALVNAGYDPAAKTLFIWEGVSYYLEPSSAYALLDCIAQFSALNSVLCFDYMSEKMESAYEGEPFLFWIAEDRLEGFLSEHGFSLEENMTPRDMEERYLTLKNGKVAYPVVTHFRFVRATVRAAGRG